jgi:stage V sporulation protein R
MTEPLDSCKDWSYEQLYDAYGKIQQIADDTFGITYYPNQIEIITSEQMLDAYAAVGMPIYYSHWSFGKQFVAESENYKRGNMGLAYEIVINSNPCISYLMEENTMMMQCLVMAHACIGHNSFFKNNTHFKQWTDAEAIIDYLAYAKHYIKECEMKYGEDEVEFILDHAHALRHQGIDRYKRPSTLSKDKQKQREKSRIEFEEQSFNDIWRTVPKGHDAVRAAEALKFPADPEENLLYFIEKHAPNLEQWKKEILRIVRKVAQYFYPQMLTQIMNEGWATFTHYNIIHEMYDHGWVTDGFMLEFTQSHTGVIKQYPGQRINPYALGFAMFNDIKRICMEPTLEDHKWFPELAGAGNWLENCKYAAYNFKDESFILQYLSPKVMRDFQMFYIQDDDNNPTMRVEAIQNDEGYRVIREKLAEQQNVNNKIPYINVVDVDVWGSRQLTMEHTSMKRHMLDEDNAVKTLRHVGALWGYPVGIKTIDETGELIEQFTYNPRGEIDKS